MKSLWISLISSLLGSAVLGSEECKNLEKQPRVILATLPTPLQEMSNISALTGCQLFIKRDDLTGLALGGNKTRKLEYLFGDALEHFADTVITAGAVQSNHCRQTAAACAKMGLRCELLLNGERPEKLQGNVLLDQIFGADIHYVKEVGAPQNLSELQLQTIASGYKPYVVPYGGSNEIGTLGYVNAMKEFLEQQKALEKPVTHIVFASCSGATHVGLRIGADMMGFTGQIIGVSVDYGIHEKEKYQNEMVALANSTAGKLGYDRLYNSKDFIVNYEYACGYREVGPLERNAILLLAQKEGILADPVYTGRAFGALLDMIAKGAFTQDDRVLFWHTGGAPALFVE